MGVAALPLVITAVTSLVSGAGTFLSGMAQSKAASYQAKVAQNNAKIAAQNAAYTEAQGAKREREEAFKLQSLVGRIKAARSASGVNVNTGSALDTVESAGLLGRMSIANVRDDFARNAYALRTQSANFLAQADLYKSEAANAKSGAIFGAATTILGGAAQVGTSVFGSGSTTSTGVTPSSSNYGGSFLGNNTLGIVR